MTLSYMKTKLTARLMVCESVYSAVTKTPKGWFKINLSSCQYRGYHCADESILCILWPPNPHNLITIYKTAFVHRVRSYIYWIVWCRVAYFTRIGGCHRFSRVIIHHALNWNYKNIYYPSNDISDALCSICYWKRDNMQLKYRLLFPAVSTQVGRQYFSFHTMTSVCDVCIIVICMWMSRHVAKPR